MPTLDEPTESPQRLWHSSWPTGVPRAIEYPEISLGQMLQSAAERYPEKTAVCYFDQKISYHLLEEFVERFGRALQERNIVRGDKVAIYLPNLPEFVIAYYGALRVGATVVTISPLYKERELTHILADSQAKVIVAWERLLPLVNATRAKTKLEHVLTANGHPPLVGISTIPETREAQSEEEVNTIILRTERASRLVDIQPRMDLALLQYTGGTTGAPKGAMLTHYNLVINAVQFSTWLGMHAQDVHLAALPLFHIYGMTTAMNAPIFTSGCIVLTPDPRDSNAILQMVENFKVTIFCGVPTMYQALINEPNIRRYDLGSLRVCISGASSLSGQVQIEFEEITGGRVVEGYGLTEMSPVTHVNPLDHPAKNRPGSIGIPISDTDAKIVDAETGTVTLPAGEPGELAIRGPQAMKGYWHGKEETEISLRDGWIYTGDIAVMDSDGYFHILDRKKDMINISGLKVWPQEIEAVLHENIAVKEAAAVAVADPESGEAVKAFVVLKDGYRGKVSESEIIKFCRERIATYKTPKIVAFRDILPRNSIGKVLRRELRAHSD